MVCDLFADDVVSVVPGAPDAGKAAVCNRLARDDRRDADEVWRNVRFIAFSTASG